MSSVSLLFWRKPRGVCNLREFGGTIESVALAGGGRFLLATEYFYTTYRLQIYDISNPNNITLWSSIALGGRPSHVEAQGHYAYVAEGYSGLEVYKLNLPPATQVKGPGRLLVNGSAGQQYQITSCSDLKRGV